MKKSVEIIGLPIISISEGRELGISKFLVIDPEQGAIAALAVESEKWYEGPKLLPFSSVTAIGEYAVTINNSADILPISEAAAFEHLLAADIRIIGTKVITKAGGIHGKITEIIVDDTGAITLCELTDTTGATVELPAARVFTYGKEVTVISETDDVDVKAVKEAAALQVKPAAPAQQPAAVKAPAVTIAPAPAAAQPPAAQPKPAPVPAEPQPSPQAEEKEDVADEVAKKVEERHRKYLLGKKASRRIETDNGILIVDQGAEITEEVLQKAKLAGKFVELTMNIQ